MVVVVLIGFMVCIGVLAYFGIALYETFRPHIYVIPEEKLFLYSLGNTRILFDYLSIYQGTTMLTNINTLFTGKYSGLNEDGSYVMLDRNRVLNAILPYHERSVENRNREIALILPGSKKPKWLSIHDFMKDQHTLLADGYKQPS